MMRTVKNRLLAATVVAAALLGVSCADIANQPFAPDVQHDLVATTLPSGTLAVRATPVAEQVVTTVVDGNGGQLSVGGNNLIIPPGAVSEPTLFSMRMVGGVFYNVDLTATRISDQAPVTTFPVELKLKMSYKDALVVDEGRLAVAYLADGTIVGRKDNVPSAVDRPLKVVHARLTHFSEYVLILE